MPLRGDTETAEMRYPVEAVIPQLLSWLSNKQNAVLIAPPGAGKTTLVAPALLDQTWCEGQILLLSPRRLAARMAAERIAELTGKQLGSGVGYATRMDSKYSEGTRILVLTEGIFRNRIVSDPELAGVSAVLFDEVHERSVDSDFGLALALEAQGAFRPDLRLLAMSATLDGERFSKLMGDAPVIESEGKSWPLEVIYEGRQSEIPVEQDLVRVIRRAMQEEEGDILAFLPGVREIDRAAEALASLLDSVVVHKLHGQTEASAQRNAVRPDPDGKRKIILATNIAETSLTIDGVRIVADSGLSRRARYDRSAGVTRLATERVSLSAATQRAGRAARQGAGIAYRLWQEAANGGLPSFDPPEILECDLAPLLLDCALWGESEPRNLRWLDPPPDAGISEAKKRLLKLRAIDENGAITRHGKNIAKLPLPPQLGHMLLAMAELDQAELGAEVAMLLSERGLGGKGDDIEARLQRWRGDKGKRAQKARKLAQGWAARAGKLSAPKGGNSLVSVGGAVALAYSDRLSKRRDKDGEYWQCAGGRGFRLDRASSLSSSGWLAVADVQGAASNARIMSAAAIAFEEVEALFCDQIAQKIDLEFDPDKGEVRAEAALRLGAITLRRGDTKAAEPEAITAALLDGVRQHGLDLLGWPEKSVSLRQRAAWAGIAELSDENLVSHLELWLEPLLHNKRRLAGIEGGDLHHALLGLIGWDAQQKLDQLAPAMFESPAGTKHAIDYAAEAGPTVTCRVQALYGLSVHPVIGADKIPLILSLTSPAGRSIQTTRDLPAFWKGSWRDVQKDMRGRYPKHHWPDDPAGAAASLATKKRQGL